MRGKAAKQLRKGVYGTTFSPRERQYSYEKGYCENTGRRRIYLNLKAYFKTLSWKNKPVKVGRPAL